MEVLGAARVREGVGGEEGDGDLRVVVVVEVFVAVVVVPGAVGPVLGVPVFAEAGDGAVDFFGIDPGGCGFSGEESFEADSLKAVKIKVVRM